MNPDSKIPDGPGHIKEQYQYRDRMIKAVTRDGHFRATIVKATDIVEAARLRHELNPLATMILGELLMGSLLVSSTLKGEERVTLQLDVDGPVKSAVAEASSHGEVRGYLANADIMPSSDDPAEMKKKAIGTGLLKVVKVLYENSRPVTSVIEAIESSPVKDLTRYYAISEQIPTAIKMDILLNDDFSVRDAIALMIQAMPGADEQDIIDLEVNIIDTPNLAKLISEGLYIDEILGKVFRRHELKELTRTPVDFFCRCSKEKFTDSLKMLSHDELTHLSQKDQELVCHYCNSKYMISKDEILGILSSK